MWRRVGADAEGRGAATDVPLKSGGHIRWEQRQETARWKRGGNDLNEHVDRGECSGNGNDHMEQMAESVKLEFETASAAGRFPAAVLARRLGRVKGDGYGD